MWGKAIAHGAISIINAIATGNGGAIGIQLKTVAEVELEEGGEEFQVNIENEPTEDPILAKTVVKKVFEKYSAKNMGARVTVFSEIPIGRGLKSSSVAANAIGLATIAALNAEVQDVEVVKLGVEASIRAGASVTGAFDDACASYYGGIFLTNNTEMKVVRKELIKDELGVVILVPPDKMYTKDVPRERLKAVGRWVDRAFQLAVDGNYWDALSLNGLIYSTALGFPGEASVRAMEKGALGAGLSGKGPAIAAICNLDSVERIADEWSGLPGQILKTRTNNQKAVIVHD